MNEEVFSEGEERRGEREKVLTKKLTYVLLHIVRHLLEVSFIYSAQPEQNSLSEN